MIQLEVKEEAIRSKSSRKTDGWRDDDGKSVILLAPLTWPLVSKVKNCVTSLKLFRLHTTFQNSQHGDATMCERVPVPGDNCYVQEIIGTWTTISSLRANNCNKQSISRESWSDDPSQLSISCWSHPMDWNHTNMAIMGANGRPAVCVLHHCHSLWSSEFHRHRTIPR